MRDDKNNSSGWSLGDSPEEFNRLWELTGAWRGGPEPQVDAALQQLHGRLAGTQQMRRRTLYRRWSMAAAILLLLAAALVFGLHFGDASAPQMLRTTQETATVELPDGSRVILNKFSELAWTPNAFTPSERLVRLKGEALFEVETDAARPFRVVTENAEVLVMGTSFNVRAYPQDEATEVAVLTGRVTLHAGSDSLQLRAAQGARFTPETGPRLEAMNVNNAIAWQTGELVFRDSPWNRSYANSNTFSPWRSNGILRNTLVRHRVPFRLCGGIPNWITCCPPWKS